MAEGHKTQPEPAQRLGGGLSEWLPQRRLQGGLQVLQMTMRMMKQMRQRSGLTRQLTLSSSQKVLL